MFKLPFYIVVLAGFGLMALVLGGIYLHSYAPRTIKLAGSWTQTYHSMADLKAHSDVAVLGHFSKVVSISAMLVRSKKDLSAVSTGFAFTVESILSDPKGKASGVGRTLVVNQAGGKNGRVTQRIIGDPLFVVNERAILFLNEYQPGFFMVIGGPTGRFTVSHTDEVNSLPGEGMKFSGSLNSFTELVRNS